MGNRLQVAGMPSSSFALCKLDACTKRHAWHLRRTAGPDWGHQLDASSAVACARHTRVFCQIGLQTNQQVLNTIKNKKHLDESTTGRAPHVALKAPLPPPQLPAPRAACSCGMRCPPAAQLPPPAAAPLPAPLEGERPPGPEGCRPPRCQPHAAAPSPALLAARRRAR